MENNNLPKQLSACDILKETTAKELASRNLHVTFNDDIKTHNICHSKLNKVNETHDASTSAKIEDKQNLNKGII